MDLFDRPEPKTLRTTEDVTPEVLEAAERCYEDWFSNDDRIDWESFIDRLADPDGNDEKVGPIEFDEYDNPAIRKIQRHVRAYVRQGG